jgi:hypothetical protein
MTIRKLLLGTVAATLLATSPALASNWLAWPTKDIANTAEGMRLYNTTCAPLATAARVIVTSMWHVLYARRLEAQNQGLQEGGQASAAAAVRIAADDESAGTLAAQTKARQMIQELGKDKWCATLAPYVAQFN